MKRATLHKTAQKKCPKTFQLPFKIIYLQRKCKNLSDIAFVIELIVFLNIIFMKEKTVLLEVANCIVRLFQGNGQNEAENADASVNVHACTVWSVEDVFLHSGEFRLFSSLLENLSECFARCAAFLRRLSRRFQSVLTAWFRLCRNYVQSAFTYRVVEGFANLHLWKATDGQPLAANVPIRCLILNPILYEKKE